MGKYVARAKLLDKRTHEAQHPGKAKKKTESVPGLNRKRKLPQAPRGLQSSTDPDDVLHDMMAAAATEGGRHWRKKRRTLERKEGERREAALGARTAAQSMETRVSLALGVKLLLSDDSGAAATMGVFLPLS